MTRPAPPTSPGQWVAGNVTDLMAQVGAAAAAGAGAATQINADLVSHDTHQAGWARHDPFSASLALLELPSARARPYRSERKDYP